MALCPSCRRPNAQGRVICAYCAAPLPRTAPSPRAAGPSLTPAPATPPPAPSSYPPPPPPTPLSRPPALPPEETAPVLPAEPPAAWEPPPPAELPAWASPPASEEIPSPLPSTEGADPDYPFAPTAPWPPTDPAGGPPGWPSAPAALPPAGYPEAKPHRHRWATVAVVVLVVVLVLLAALWAAGRLHSSAGSSGVGHVEGTPLLYSQASGPAATAQSQAEGAPWTTYGVEGWGLDESVAGAGGLIANCTTLWSNASTIVIPETPANASTGMLAAWIFAATNASGALLLTVVADVSGSVTGSNVVIVRGACTALFTGEGPIGSAPVDSSTVVRSADADGGTAYRASHTVATELVSLLGPYWDVVYTSCDLFNSNGGSGSEFAAVFYAGNGTLVSNLGVTSVPC